MEREVLRTVDLVSESAGRRRLDHVNLLLTAGTMLGIIGRTGAGKTQLAKVLSGECPPNTGALLLYERPASMAALQREGLRISSGSRLLGNLSIAENLLSVCYYRRVLWRPARMRALCAEILTSFGLEDWLDVSPDHLPPIVHHQLLLVRAALLQKKFVILEDVSERYSAEEQSELLETIRILCSRGIALLYVSRRMDLVQRGAHRLAVLTDGHIVKHLLPQQFEPSSLHAYLHGYQLTDISPDAQRLDGAPLFSLPGIQIHAGAFLRINDGDGTAGELVRAVCASCTQAGLPAPGILNDAVLDAGFIEQMSILDNIVLTAAPKAAGPFWHMGRRMLRLLRQECSRQTGLTDAQMLLHPMQLTRNERLRLLLYRFSILDTRVYVIDRPSADESDRVNLKLAIDQLLIAGCAVLYIANNADELFAPASRILTWINGTLREEPPCV